MERRHADRIQEKFADALKSKPVVVLRIPDKYPFGDSQLVALLRQKLLEYLPLLSKFSELVLYATTLTLPATTPFCLLV